MNTISVLDSSQFLDRAAKEYLLNGADEFIFNLRKKYGIENFYFLLEKELQNQNIFKIADLREVKEGFVKVARPSAIKITLSSLLEQRPALKEQRQTFLSACHRSPFFNFYNFFSENYGVCIREYASLFDCLEILNYLIQNQEQVKGLLARQIAHGKSTKILGQSSLLLKMYAFWKKQPTLSWDDFFENFGIIHGTLEFRFYSPISKWQGTSLNQFHGLISTELKKDWIFPVGGTLILENFESFLSLSQRSQNTLLIWGSGWKAVQLETIWELFPQPIYYWGDLDKEGLEILNNLANRVLIKPIPLLMDMSVIEKFPHLIQSRAEDLVEEISNTKELKILPHVYSYVIKNKIRIEQEQIPWADIIKL